MVEVNHGSWHTEHHAFFPPEQQVWLPSLKVKHHRLQKLLEYFQSLALENKSLKARTSHLEKTIICAEVRFGEFAMKHFQSSKPPEQGSGVVPQQAAEQPCPPQAAVAEADVGRCPELTTPGGNSRTGPVLVEKQTQVSHHLTREGEPLTAGVSRQYFDLVIQELARTKKYLRDLQKERGVDLQEAWKLGQALQRCQDLERENICLQNDLMNVKSLLEESSDHTDASKLLALQEKVTALEKEREERDASLSQMKKQLAFFQQLCRALASQHCSPKSGSFRHLVTGSDVFRDASTSTDKDEGDDQVFADIPPTKDTEGTCKPERSKDSGMAESVDAGCSLSHQPALSQTAAAHAATGVQQPSLVEAGVQTEPGSPAASGLPPRSVVAATVQTEEREDKELLDLRQRVESLTACNKELADWNKNLQHLYQGTLESLRQVSDSQKVRSLQQRVQRLESQASLDQRALQQLHLQVEGLRQQLAQEKELRREAEEALARKSHALHQQVNLTEKLQGLQSQVAELTREKQTLATQLLSSKVAAIQPLPQSAPPPASSSLSSQFPHSEDKLWKKDLRTSSGPELGSLYQTLKGGETTLPSLGTFHKIQSDLDSPPASGLSDRVCSHCLRSDFTDDNSYINHMQKCLD